MSKVTGKLLTVDQAAERLGTSVTFPRRLIAERRRQRQKRRLQRRALFVEIRQQFNRSRMHVGLAPFSTVRGHAKAIAAPSTLIFVVRDERCRWSR